MTKGLVFELGPYTLTPKIKNKVINSNVQIYDSSHGDGTMSAINQAIENLNASPWSADVWSQYIWNKSNLQIEIATMNHKYTHFTIGQTWWESEL